MATAPAATPPLGGACGRPVPRVCHPRHSGYSRLMEAGEIASERTEPGVAVITFSGEHDLNTAPDLRQKLTTEIDDGFAVVVDLSGAAFIDSSILGAVLDARRRARDAGIGF